MDWKMWFNLIVPFTVIVLIWYITLFTLETAMDKLNYILGVAIGFLGIKWVEAMVYYIRKHSGEVEE